MTIAELAAQASDAIYAKVRPQSRGNVVIVSICDDSGLYSVSARGDDPEAIARLGVLVSTALLDATEPRGATVPQ